MLQGGSQPLGHRRWLPHVVAASYMGDESIVGKLMSRSVCAIPGGNVHSLLVKAQHKAEVTKNHASCHPSHTAQMQQYWHMFSVCGDLPASQPAHKGKGVFHCPPHEDTAKLVDGANPFRRIRGQLRDLLHVERFGLQP